MVELLKDALKLRQLEKAIWDQQFYSVQKLFSSMQKFAECCIIYPKNGGFFTFHKILLLLFAGSNLSYS